MDDRTHPTGSQMTVVYAMEEPPQAWSKAIFAAGPTPRSAGVSSWRPELLRLLDEHGYDGVVFVPEDRTGVFHGDYDGQVAWEERCLHLADVVLFWVPRDMDTLPALTTNVEFGTWVRSGKVVFGAPSEAARNTYLRYHAEQQQVPMAVTLPDTVTAALDMLGPGAWRTGGQREVPLLVWNAASFQTWHDVQTAAGNTLTGARVEWTLRNGPAGAVFLWALHVRVWVAAEQRTKSNEVVLGRTDVTAVVAYQQAPDLADSPVVLVREFRAAAVTGDGFVRECPGGSSPTPSFAPLDVAVTEVAEEVGLRLHPARLRAVGTRQLAATFSAHRAHVFAVELTNAELDALRAAATAGEVFGEPGTSERTYIEVHTIGELLERPMVDWSTLGMVLAAINAPTQ